MSSYIKIIFTVSVMLNLLFAGIVGTYAIKKHGNSGSPEFVSGLSDDGKKVVGDVVSAAKNDMKKDRKFAKKARMNLIKIMAADVFDPDAYDEAMVQMHGYKMAMMSNIAERTKEILLKLPKEEREKFSKRIIRKLDGRDGVGQKHRNRPIAKGRDGIKDKIRGLSPEDRRRLRGMSGDDRRKFLNNMRNSE